MNERKREAAVEKAKEALRALTEWSETVAFASAQGKRAVRLGRVALADLEEQWSPPEPRSREAGVEGRRDA